MSSVVISFNLTVDRRTTALSERQIEGLVMNHRSLRTRPERRRSLLLSGPTSQKDQCTYLIAINIRQRFRPFICWENSGSSLMNRASLKELFSSEAEPPCGQNDPNESTATTL